MKTANAGPEVSDLRQVAKCQSDTVGATVDLWKLNERALRPNHTHSRVEVCYRSDPASRGVRDHHVTGVASKG